jgi:hypothetical protein
MLTRVCAGFARAISRATTNSARRRFSSHESAWSPCDYKSGCSSSAEPRRTCTDAGGKRPSRGSNRARCARRNRYRYFKSRAW